MSTTEIIHFDVVKQVSCFKDIHFQKKICVDVISGTSEWAAYKNNSQEKYAADENILLECLSIVYITLLKYPKFH
jgi:MinD-like ATPase involved in chromosome partitioning or flagellar assembly